MSHFQIDEAEASREIYRVHLPGAENDLYSLLDLRELALRKVIKPGTLISREGQSFQAPASSIPTVFSTASAGQGPISRRGLFIILLGALAIGLGFLGLAQLPKGGSYSIGPSFRRRDLLHHMLRLLTRIENHVQIDEAEASREIYRVHLPGAENDLYSALELRQMALKKVITPRTPISIEGENIRVPASSIHTVYSPRSRLFTLVLWCVGCVALVQLFALVGFIAVLIKLPIPVLTLAYLCIGIAGAFMLLPLYQLFTGTAVDQQGRPLS